MLFSSTLRPLALLAAVALPAAAQPRTTQLAAAVEYRTQVGKLDASSDARSGLALRVMGERRWLTRADWRLEGAYTQVQYDRHDPGGTTPVNENGFELGGFLRAHLATETRWRPYTLAGVIGSLRASCTIDSAFQGANIECGDGDDVLFGWGAGGGIRYVNALAGWDLFLESRLLSGVTSAGGKQMIAVALGAVF